MQYLAIIERGETGFGAYVPDLPGCIAAAESKQEVVNLIRDAVEFHIEGLVEHGEAVPAPSSRTVLVKLEATKIRVHGGSTLKA
ncbi:MAG: type II toxin-antitoxin system HicB family antitoxin [Acidobacteria bacterium]|nr:type II toxin-antitoxin system HicB family antitoxin [Acidobacteriota bacterium]